MLVACYVGSVFAASLTFLNDVRHAKLTVPEGREKNPLIILCFNLRYPKCKKEKEQAGTVGSSPSIPLKKKKEKVRWRLKVIIACTPYCCVPAHLKQWISCVQTQGFSQHISVHCSHFWHKTYFITVCLQMLLHHLCSNIHQFNWTCPSADPRALI